MHNQWLPIPSSLSSFSPPPSPLGASFKFQVGGLKGWGVLWPLIGLHNKAGLRYNKDSVMRSGTFYFISVANGHCEKGHRMIVKVIANDDQSYEKLRTPISWLGL
ncbi:hypothetical protein Csa_009010 [Cucumis sativus]|nr:hypothetical protein Csa_009010 [Cucumis sativus]